MEEMMTFSLTLNRFMNPSSYWVEHTDQRRQEDLEKAFYNNVKAFETADDYKSISIKGSDPRIWNAHDEYANLQFKPQNQYIL